MLPIGAEARVLVMFEQFAGVGYIAAVVSRLIGLNTSAGGATTDGAAGRRHAHQKCGLSCSDA